VNRPVKILYLGFGWIWADHHMVRFPRGESLLHDVVLDGRVVVSSPKQYFRKPRCHGLKNLQDEAIKSCRMLC